MSGYPKKPGWRATATGETSRATAHAVEPKAGPLCERIYHLLSTCGPKSAEELMAERGDWVLLNSVRARCTQLHKQGRVRDSGQRGVGESGKVKVIRWEIVPVQTEMFPAVAA